MRAVSGADLVVVGDVYTVDAARRWAQAVAIAGDRITAVGTEAEIREAAGPSAEVIRGAMVLPGFQDAHIHPAFAGRDLGRVRIDHLSTPREYLDHIGAYARSHPDEPWIVGGGWAMFLFPGGTPRKEDLDAVVPDRPVFLMNRDVHGAWLNSRALELGGIDASTPDPWDGRIERDPGTGEPTGMLHEGAAYSFWEHVVPPTEPQEWREAILRAQAFLHPFGITGWQDAWVGPELLRAYRGLADSDELTARVSASLWWERNGDASQIDGFVEQRAWAEGGPLRASTVKIMTDGVVENCTCALLEPYLGPCGEGDRPLGISYVDAAPLRDAVTRLDAAGFQVHMHAIGDRAVRQALDAVGAAREANGARGMRHHIAHLQFVHPDDIPRFRDLDVVANCQPLWACNDPQMEELTLSKVGDERARELYPFGDLHRNGATLAMGSDWGVSSPNPLLEMEVAITRVDPDDRDGEPLLPEQALDLPTAIAAFTRGSAFVSHDDDAGSIRVGARADLAVLDRNVFEPAAGPLGEARVTATIAAGRVVHDASA